MKKESVLSGTWAAIAFIVFFQLVLPVLAAGMHRKARNDAAWSRMSESQRAAAIQERAERTEALIDADRETPSPLDR